MLLAVAAFDAARVLEAAAARGPKVVEQAQALLLHLEGRCAKYRWPRHIFFWDALPKSGYGKITKKDIRQMLEERGDLQQQIVT